MKKKRGGNETEWRKREEKLDIANRSQRLSLGFTVREMTDLRAGNLLGAAILPDYGTCHIFPGCEQFGDRSFLTNSSDYEQRLHTLRSVNIA